MRSKFVVLLLPFFWDTLASQAENVPFGQVLTFESRTHFNPVGASARAIGMGGAFIGVADDATAASFNPAGLAQLEYPEFSFVARRSSVAVDYTGFSSHDQVPDLPLTDSAVTFNQLNLDFVSATLPFEIHDHNISVQVSFQDLFDLYADSRRDFDELDERGNREFHLTERARQKGGIHTVSVSLAGQVTSRLSVGWTVNYWMGDWTLDGLYRETGIQKPTYDEYVSFHQTNDLSGWNHNFGIMLRYAHLRIGGVVRTPFDAHYDYSIETQTNAEDPELPFGKEKTSLHWPLSIGAGILVRPTDKLSIAFDITRTWWSKAFLTSAREPAEPINFFDLREETTTPNTTQVRGGAEYILVPGSFLIPLRFGAFSDPPPTGDTGTGERQSFRGLTAGFGVKRGPLQIDVAAEYRVDTTRVRQFIEPDNIAEGIESAGATGTVDVRDVRMYVSAIYRIQNRTAVGDFLRFLFVGPRKK